MRRKQKRIWKIAALAVMLGVLWYVSAPGMPDYLVRAEETEETGEEDVISPGEIYVEEPALSVQMRSSLMGDTQKIIYNPGGADLTDVLGVEREHVLNWLGQHLNDGYYLGTPYVPNDWRSPNGDVSFNGAPGMNCTGFVWHVLRAAGANEHTPGIQGWVSMIVNNRMEYVTYTGSNWNDVSSSVAWDGICEPGDIIWTWDMTKGDLQDGLSRHSSPRHHVSIFIGSYFDSVKAPGTPSWQEGEVFDRIWHSSDDNAAGVQEIGNVATWMVPKEWAGPYAVTVLKMKNRKGTMELWKTSANTQITEQNPCYSLEGAEYGIFHGDTMIDSVKTDQSGYAKKEGLPAGTYRVKELTPPEGFAVDNRSYELMIEAGETTQLNVQDIPQCALTEAVVFKKDAETGQAVPQGDTVLKDARFTVRYYPVQSGSDPALQGNAPVRTWILRTDEAGVAKLEKEYLVSGDAFYQDGEGRNVLPLGTVTIQETKAPSGYLLNPEIFVRQITPEGTGESAPVYHMPAVLETPQKGIIELHKKDAETEKNVPQGAGTLKGAVYDIFVKSVYQPGDHTGSPSYCGTIITDENGRAESKELPLDTYYVIERQAGTGYLVDPGIHEVILGAENAAERVFRKTVEGKEKIIRGNVEIIKVKENENEDQDTLEGLEGAEFTFRSDTTGKVVKKIVTDKKGYATTAGQENPRGGLIYDTYTVTETKCPDGLKPVEPFQVTIKEEGVTLKGIYKEDKLIASPVSVVKTDQGTGKNIPLAGTRFRLLDQNKTPVTMVTYYPEKVVHEYFQTDQNGQFTFPEKLKAGTYYLEEIKAPRGYLKGELLKFEVKKGAVWEQPLVVRYENENVMGQIRITKRSADEKEKLDGAVFEIRAAEDIVTPEGTVRMKKGDLADIVTTESGEAVSKRLYLGKYDVLETRQPDGFVLDREVKTVELEYKDQDSAVVFCELEVYNRPTEITLVKIDAETKQPLKGVRFNVWKKAMESETDAEMGVVQEFVTGEDGMFTIGRLAPGTYCFQETETLPGYSLDEKIYELTLDQDGKGNGDSAGQLIVENVPVKPEIPEETPPEESEIPEEPEKPEEPEEPEKPEVPEEPEKPEVPEEPERTEVPEIQETPVAKTGDGVSWKYAVAAGCSGVILLWMLRRYGKRR